jgi:hypothetical protein
MNPNKTKEQIIDAYENRVVMKVIAGMVLTGGIVLTIIVSNRPSSVLPAIVLAVSFAIAFVLMIFALRCPICDSWKSHRYVEIGIIRMATGFYHCEICNLSNGQVREYVDLLKRGVEIDKNVLARLYKRDL